jgi:uncharacterized protein YjbI with pentapeptide repeats
MRWPLGRHVAAVLVFAITTVVAVVAVLWWILGAPGVRVSGPLAPGEAENVLKIALTVVAGAGGVVALVVAYRRQQLHEVAEQREDVRLLNERFGAAAEQLGSAQSAVRMAGAYAMAALADDWAGARQRCIDVLCGYLRMPHSPQPPGDDEGREAWRRERAVRLTVLRLIAEHLRGGPGVLWRGYDLDLTGAVLDEADFRGARFVGGEIIFINAVFAGHGHDQVIFDDVEFAEGTHVYFRLAELRGGRIRFNRARFTGGWVSFDGARFCGANVDFRDAEFTAGEVLFEGAEFADGLVDFAGARLIGTTVNFAAQHLPTVYTTVPAARFTGGTVDFTHAAQFSDPPRFGLSSAPPGLLLPPGTEIADLP